MNKIIKSVSVLIIFCLIGCKSETKKTEISDKKTCAEEVQEAILNPGNHDNVALAALLKECGGFICNQENVELLKLIEPIHNTPKSDYEILKTAFWNTNTPDFKEFTWKEIDSISENYCYDKYLAFSCDFKDTISAQDIKMDVVEDFTLSPTCYSIALFKSIKAKYPQINDSTKFKFTKAILNKSNCVIFEVNDATISIFETFDMSQDPLFINPPLVSFLKQFLIKLNK
jgi:hypothetical protein